MIAPNPVEEALDALRTAGAISEQQHAAAVEHLKRERERQRERWRMAEDARAVRWARTPWWRRTWRTLILFENVPGPYRYASRAQRQEWRAGA